MDISVIMEVDFFNVLRDSFVVDSEEIMGL